MMNHAITFTGRDGIEGTESKGERRRLGALLHQGLFQASAPGLWRYLLIPSEAT